ncbi:hypothetical protein ACQ4LE_003669 [Meloidogyne hapla]
MSSHHVKFRNKFRKRHDANEVDENSLIVFGYSSKLHKTENVFSVGDDFQSTSSAVAFDENKHLIPWNGDEELKIDRYDVRLYLTSLDEFDKEIKNLEGKRNDKYDEDEANSAEQLEEELCDEQRYADLYVDMRQKEIEEQNKNRKRAEIGYSYDEQQPSPLVEEEEDEPYIKPISLKLPVGIATPDSVRQNLLIERTALFVVEKGPQMEVVIKAKQRHKAEQFGFLDFDHRLHPFYKYLCKQIREKKYVPELRQPAKKKKEPEPIYSESDDSDGGYLHPLLCGDAKKAKTEAMSDPEFIGPSQKPKQIIKKPESSNCDLDVLIQKFHRSDDQNSSSSLYSSLMKSLHSLIHGQPKEKEETIKNNENDKKVEEKRKENEKKVEEPAKPQQPEILYETDESRINDYNLWHLEFYGRQSPYLPGPPPFPLTPAADSVVESGIAVAAKYVAFQGVAAEQKLIEHNGDKVHFLSARSPYYTFYQSKVRQLQWQIYQQQQQINLKLNKNTQQSAPQTQKSLIKQIIQAATSKDLTPIELLVGSKRDESCATSNGVKEEDGADFGDKKQQERREKARLFMERILNERMAEKHSGKKRLKDGGDKLPVVQPPGIISTPIILSDTKNENEEEKNKNTKSISPYNLSKTISTMIDMHIKKTFGEASTPTGRTGSDYVDDNSPRDGYEDTPKRKKEKHKKRKSRERKKRERSTSSKLFDGSEEEEEKEERKRKKHKRRRERSDSRHRKHHRSSRHRSYSSSSSRSRSPKYSRKSRDR